MRTARVVSLLGAGLTKGQMLALLLHPTFARHLHLLHHLKPPRSEIDSCMKKEVYLLPREVPIMARDLNRHPSINALYHHLRRRRLRRADRGKFNER